MSPLKLIPPNLSPENLEKLESLPYQIHHFHEAVEDLIRVVANYCENKVTDSAQLHRLIVDPKANETANERKTAG